MNRSYRLIWSDRLNTFVVAAETTRARGKRSAAAVLLSAAAGISQAHAQAPVPAPTQLPTGGKVVAGQAAIAQSNPTRLDINQSSNRAAIDWQTFNIGSKAQVNFNQPGPQAATLNRVLDTQASQIYGRITANGQVFLTNPSGVYFSPSASVDVGGLAATTHSVGNADFMAGKNTLQRNGATGAVVNQGKLNTTVGGYIALLAPEVRNEGAIVAHTGTVALAAGEAITLNISGANTLAGVTVTPAQINTLVENKHAIFAPGGLVILSAQAADKLQGGVVRNSGSIEASGITQRAGRIVLEASQLIDNKGIIKSDAGADFSPAGTVSGSAKVIVNAGSISAVQAGADVVTPTLTVNVLSQSAGGNVSLQTSQTLTQTITGRIDVSGSSGGGVVLKADHEIALSGSVRATGTDGAEGVGGSIAVIAPHSVSVQAMVDVSGAARGGSVQIQAIPSVPSLPAGPQSPGLPTPRSNVALLSSAQIRAGGSRGQGGSVTIEGEYIRLAEGALIDARGANGGGTALIGGDWQGTGTLFQATSVIQERGALIDVSATVQGDGGKVVLWSDIRNRNSTTVFDGMINATGAGGGKGGRIETSGHRLAVSGAVSAGKGGQWLLDPFDVVIDNNVSSNMDGNFVAQGSPAVLLVTTLENALTAGTDVTVSTGPLGNSGTEAGNITLNADIRPGAMANDATLTLKADRSVIINAGYSIDATQNGNTNRLNVVLQANASDLGSGGVVMGSNSAIKSNGGNITLGGGSDMATGYAVGVGSGSAGRGIWLQDGTLLNAGGGNIALRGQGKTGGEGIVLGDGGVAGAGSSTLVTGNAGNITLTGMGTTGAAGGTPSGIRLHNDVRIQAESGSVSLFGSGGATLDAGADNSGILAGPGTRILSGGGPITLEGAAGTGVGTDGLGIRFIGGTTYLGHDDGVNLGYSASHITLTADTLSAVGSSTVINTAGMLTFQPLSASFSNTFTFGGSLSGMDLVGADSISGIQINYLQGVSVLTLGKPGNTSGITLASALTLDSQLNLIGGDVQINQPLTINNIGLVVTNSGTFTTGDGVAITSYGGITQNGTGANNIGGDIITPFSSLGFSRDVAIRNNVLMRASGDIQLNGAVSGAIPNSNAQLTLVSDYSFIAINGAVSNLERLTLTSSSGVVQSASIQVNQLLLNGAGGMYTLTHPGNQIGTLAANVDTGSIELVSNAPLVIGTVNGVSGAVSTGGTVQIATSSAHALTVNQPVSAPSPTLIAGGNIILNNSVTATSGDLVIAAGGAFVNNTGLAALAAAGRWLVYSASPDANTYGGAVSNNTGLFGKTFASYDPATVTADGYGGKRYLFASLPPAIAVNTMNASSVYGDSPASLAGNYSIALPSTYGGVIVAPVLTGVPVISSAGSSSTAAAGNYTVTADISVLSADVPGYSFTAVNTGTLNVAQRPVTLSGSRIYDATTTISATQLTAGNVVNGDSVGFSGSGLLSGKNVGTRTLSGAGTLAVSNSNYTLNGATGTIVISPAGLSISGVTANPRTYDATTIASLSGTAQVSPLATDAVTIAGTAVAAFADKNVGSHKPVSVTGYTLQGADAANYSVQQPQGLAASISPAALSISGVTANPRTYDATTIASLSGTAQVSPLATDAVTVAGSAVVSFADKNVGSHKPVSVTGYTLQGADAANYSVQQPQGLAASISPAALSISGVTANPRTYDATTIASLSGTAQVSPLATDAVTIAGTAVAAFADKNVGSHKPVSVSGYTLQGADAANYSVQQPQGLAASISPAALSISGVTANPRTYDATTIASLSGTAQVSPLATDAVTVAGSAVVSFADKNVGSHKPVSVTGYTLQGADAANYSVQQPQGLAASISPAGLSISGVTANPRTYDATTIASLSGTAQVSPLATDAVTIAGTAVAAFADKNVGSHKPVSVSGYTLQGADAANYSVQQPQGLAASISPAALSISGVTANPRTYDATTIASLSGTAQVSPLATDAVTVAGSAVVSFADKNVGSHKPVSVTGYTLQGADAANYSVQQPQGLAASISPAGLSISGVTANPRTYDATTIASLSGTAQVSPLATDAVTIAGTAVAAFADKNVGSHKPVSVTGYTLQGADAANYSVQQPQGLAASISPAALSISGVTANPRTYDATTIASLSGTAQVSPLATDAVTVAGSAVVSFADKNVGSHKPVSVTGYTLQGADAANYSVQQPQGLAASISPAGLSISGVTANPRTYDATTIASLSGTAQVSPLATDAVTIAGTAVAAFADKHVGSHKPVSVTGYTLQGADAANYSVQQPQGLAASISPAALSISGVTANPRTYDATTIASLSGTAQVSPLATDAVTVAGSAVVSFADKNVGSHKPVSVTGYTLQGADAANYSVQQPQGLAASISPAGLSISGVTANPRTYDATTIASLSGTAQVSPLATDAVTIAGTAVAAFADKNVGSHKPVSVSGYTLQGADAANYSVQQPQGLAASISPAALSISGVTANPRTYDATTIASLSGTAQVSPLATDAVTVAGSAVVSFADKNVGSHKPVSVTGYTLQGADAANYSVQQPQGLAASISPAALTISGVTANPRTYDATTIASLSGTAQVSPLATDAVTIAGTAVAAFADKNVGSHKPVSVSGYTLQGADAANYSVQQPQGLAASISPAALSISGVTANPRTYDATTIASLSGTAQVSPLATDAVTVAGSAVVSFADKNVGSHKPVSVTGYTLQGADAANYSVQQPQGLAASISPAGLSISGVTANPRTYDATTIASLSGTAQVSPLATDAVTIAGTAVAAFADKNVGSHKPVSVSGYTLQGADAANYSVQQPQGLAASISPAALSISGVTANPRTYDATTIASLSGTAQVSPLATDAVTVAGSAVVSFADKNVGSHKPVSVTGYTLQGADAANYSVQQPQGLAASISPAGLSISGVTANPRTYDATTIASLSGTAQVSPLATDAVTIAGTAVAAFADKHVGSHKPVSVTGYTLQGADAANYSVQQPQGLAASISPAALSISGVTANPRTYDATTIASLSGTAQVSPLATDAVTVAGSAVVSFADKNVGSHKPVSVTGYTLQGADAANYSVQQPQGLAASISPAALTISGVTANPRTYDATTIASLSGTAQVSPLATDAVTIAGTAVAAFADKNVGSHKPVSVSGYTLQGADAANYSVQQPQGLAASIVAIETPVEISPPGPTTNTVSTVTAAIVGSSGLTLPPPPPVIDTRRGPGVLPGATSGGTLDVSGLSALVAGGVSVTQINDLPAPAAGEVAVIAALKDSETPGRLRFPLPLKLKHLMDAAPTAVVYATLRDESPLPSWIKFDYGSRSFVTAARPPYALPVDLLLAVGKHRAVVRIVAASREQVAVVIR